MESPSSQTLTSDDPFAAAKCHIELHRVETEVEKKFNSGFDESVFKAFKEFMAGVAEFEELVAVGGRLLSGFRQGLEVLRRPPIDKSSQLVKNIINDNKTKRVQSYLEGGCINTHDSMENISKCRIILDQLESLLDDVTVTLRTQHGNLPPFSDRIEGVTCEEEEEIGSSCAERDEAGDRALLMAVIYKMIKQDFLMQERIILALNLNTSSGELESYSLMWSLRPFVNDCTMDQAWKLIP